MRLIILVFPLLLLTACGVAEGAQPGAPDIQASPQVVAHVAPASAVPTFTLAPPGSPTPDYAAQIGLSQLQLQQSVASATLSELTQVPIRHTQAALDTQTASGSQTAEAHGVQTQSAIKTATVQAPITQRLQRDADWEPYWQFVLLAGAVVLILLAVYCIYAIADQALKYIYEKRQALHGQKPVQTTALPTVTLDNRDKYGWGQVNFTTLPIDRLTLQMVAELITTGSHYTQAQMTGSAGPLVKDGNFNTFGDWMVANGIAVRTGDGRYPLQHSEFFKQVLSV